jgi:adenylate cyclase
MVQMKMPKLFKINLKNPFWIGILASSLILLSVMLNLFNITDHGRNTSLDWMTKLYPFERLYPDNSKLFAFIDIDDKSIQEMGQWPWPRQLTAKLIDKVSQSGPVAIGLDILFTEEDRFSPNHLSEALGVSKESITSIGAIDGDQVLGKAIRKTPTVTSFVLSTQDMKNAKIHAGRFVVMNDADKWVPVAESLILPIEALDGSIGGGFVNTYKMEGLIRDTPMVAQVQNEILPALSLDLLRVAQQADSHIINMSGAGQMLIKTGRLPIQLSEDGSMIFHHGHTSRFETISAVDFFKDKSPDLKGKIVVIGSAASGLGDFHSTNLEDDVAGPIFHLQAMDQIVSGRFIKYHIGYDRLVFILCSLLSILFSYLIGRVALGYIILFVPLIASALFATAAYYFYSAGFIFNIPMTGMVLFGGVISTYISKSIIEANLRKKIQGSFAQYVPADIVQQISDSTKLPELGGEEVICTVLFLDIRGFTTLTEKLKDNPKLLVSAIATIMNQITNKLVAEGATIDKYIGDAVMAFWNAPILQSDHQIKAYKAALNIVQFKEAIQQEVRNLSPVLKKIQIDFGIGIATGPVIVGNMGSDFRFNYTVMGDTVNVAARLESLTKEKKESILVSDPLLNMQKNLLKAHQINFSLIDHMLVKGKKEKINIYTIRAS